MKFLFTLTAFALFAGLAHAADPECGKDQAGGVSYTWCIYRPTAGTNRNVLYYLHGGGNNEHAWELESAVRDQWVALGADAPTVISFSFGPSWLLGDVTTPQHPPLLPIVQNQIMPFLEGKIGGVHGERIVAGPSMGGYNSAELALRSPGLFSRVALECPGIMTIKPFVGAAEVDAFMKSHPIGVRRSNVEHLMQWAQSDFGTPAVWDRHDPLELVKLVRGSKTRFFLSCTRDDDYGFFDGAERFAQILKSNHVAAEFVAIDSGGHCAQSLRSMDRLSRFLAH